MPQNVILQTNFPDIKLFKRGKVRDIYQVGDYYLMISTDRISAFDVIMNEGIPLKGAVLTKISEFWFNKFAGLTENHLVTTNVEEFPHECDKYKTQLKGRSMLVRRAELIPIECIVRGYISGSGWKDYQKTGTICGIKLPPNLVESEILPEPIFTPSTKAEIGDHDENISESKAKDVIGSDMYDKIKSLSLKIYTQAYKYALERGIILADTKMEFGTIDGKIILIDELLTPDSSRFWPLESYVKGGAQLSFDKQYVRDYLLSVKFNKQPPAPSLPDEVVQNTSLKYQEALFKLTGQNL